MSRNTLTSHEWASLGRQLANYHLDIAIRLADDFNDVRATFESLASTVADYDWRPRAYRHAYRGRLDVLLSAHKFDQMHSYGSGDDEPVPGVCACCQGRYFDYEHFHYIVCPSCEPDGQEFPPDYRWGPSLVPADDDYPFKGHECRWEPMPFTAVCSCCGAGFDSKVPAQSVCPSCQYEDEDC